LKPKSYPPTSNIEITKEDLLFWLLWTNSALVNVMSEHKRLDKEVRRLTNHLKD
jgi:hypothetical protein